MSLDIFKDTSSTDCPSPTFSFPSSQRNIVYSNHKAIYQDVSTVKILARGNTSVYLVRSNVNRKIYVMKVFPFEGERPSIHFSNEARFACFQHPNIIRSLYFENERSAKLGGTTSNVSYTIMEHAEHGDLENLMLRDSTKFTETVARTYFRQLISGLEYLHKNGVAHLDIKLDNLLVDSDYNLKITDFDVACFSEDTLILSRGTKLYRAPEIQHGKCSDLKAADIYSAAIVLFILMTQGVFPHMEDEAYKKIDFQGLLRSNVKQFWSEHRRVQRKGMQCFNKDFCDLFIGMTREGSEKRMTIDKIKESKWYNGPVYDAGELKSIFKVC